MEYDKDFSNWLKSKVEETQHFTITERDIAAAKRNAKEQHHGNGSRGDGMSTERIDGSSKWPTGRTTIHRPAKKFSYNVSFQSTWFALKYTVSPLLTLEVTHFHNTTHYSSFSLAT